MGKIADVSKYQGTIDWSKASQELDMVIIRVQYGSLTEDECHAKNEQGAKANGVPFGEYAFGHFVSVDDAKVEANDFLKRISPDAKFLVLDVEQLTIDACGTANIAEASQAFIDTCKAAGHKVGFYVSHNLYKSYGLDGVKADFLWIPRYGGNDGQPSTKPDYACELWQYTSVGSVLGVQGDVDLSQLNGDKDLSWFVGEDGDISPIPQPAPKKSIIKKVIETVEKIIHHKVSYSVKSGDTLISIAAQFNTTVDQLVKDNKISNPNKIYVGQLLHVGTTETIKQSTPSKSSTYTVKSGDSLSKIASDHGMSLAEIEKLNPQISNPNIISVGEKINLSGQSTKSESKVYTVVDGDTLSEICAKHNVNMNVVVKLNGISDPSKIYVGQKIKLN